MRRLMDRLVGAIADLATFGWFRSVEVTGLDRFPRHGPVLVVASHGGGFVDPALLARVLPRLPRFLATASLWRYVVTRPLLALAGAIPVAAASDGPTGGNLDALAASRRVLAEGGVVAIFPEGHASDQPHLLPVKTGAARIALGALAEGVEGLVVVPIGVVYEDKASARSRAFVRVGGPLDVAAWAAAELTPARVVAGAGDHEAVRELTAELRGRLARVSLDFRDAAELDALATAAAVALRPAGAEPRSRPPLARVEELAGRLAASPGRAASVREAAEAYREALEANAVSDEAVAAAPDAGGAFHRLHLAGALITILALPLAVAGVVVNAVPGIAVHAAGRPAMAPVTRATAKFLVALVGFPLAWSAFAWLVSGRVEHPWVVTALAGPVCGAAALWVVDRVRRGRRARLDIARLTGVRSSLEDLRARRARVVAEVGSAVGRVRA